MIRRAELVSTGAELLDGRVLNAHAQWLGACLVPVGFQLVRDTTVPDDATAMREAIAAALDRADLVFVTGGLGPTSDDLTRDVVAGLLGSRIVLHAPTVEAIRAWVAARGRQMNESMERHALVVEGAEVLPNPVGLAPGERLEHQGKPLVLLPGPTHEFRRILQDSVLPWLPKAFPGVQPPACRSLRLCGPGESEIVSKLLPLGFPGEGVDVAYCARAGDVEVRLVADQARSGALEDAAALVREHFAASIFADTSGETVTMEQAVGALLQQKGLTIATAESCTGGLVAHRLTNISGSSSYYRGGVVAYANEVKMRLLGVDAGTLAQHGAVSEPVAREMADGVRRVMRSDIAIATTGIAGPTGGTAQKPVGLVYIAVADAAGVAVRELRASGGREYIKNWAAQMALDAVRRRLSATPEPLHQ